MGNDLSNEWADRRQRFESVLRDCTDRCLVGAPSELGDAIRYSLFAPGKRLRPILVMLACEAAQGNESLAYPAACAIEMVHTYSLIHDDLPAMDDDDLRRGRPTCHKQFNEALAILAGDALLTMAFQVISEGYRGNTAAVIVSELAMGAGAVGMVGGQVLDLAAEQRTSDQPASIEMLENIHRRKTGALYRASLRMGFWASGSEDHAILEALDRYGRAFGLAFQIADDLLDVEATAEETGKRTGKDADRGKLTYPGLLGVEESRQRAVQLGEDAICSVEALGRQADPLARLIRLVVERKR